MPANYYPYASNSFGQNNYFGPGNAFQAPMPSFQAQMAPQQQMQQPVQTAPAPSYNVVPIKSNKIFVTSLDEALNRFAEPNSETIYLHQDQPLLFEVKVDAQGRKEYHTYELRQPQQSASQAPNMAQDAQKIDLSAYVTQKEFNELTERFNNLLDQLRAPKRAERVKEAE